MDKKLVAKQTESVVEKMDDVFISPRRYSKSLTMAKETAEALNRGLEAFVLAPKPEPDVRNIAFHIPGETPFKVVRVVHVTVPAGRRSTVVDAEAEDVTEELKRVEGPK